jgi:hypothetical protein
MREDPWTRLLVAAEGTHHLLDGLPAYGDRFDTVLPFHAPGLAPVQRGAEAWHIRADGTPAYTNRYPQTFGFYGGRAAVAASDGWCHVGVDGRPLYAERYAWCGNFQRERVPVRRRDGRYLHLDADGAPVSPTSWRYAGDYREGSAVVQRDDGLHGHVDRDGRPLHGGWFLDLDVFHKGLARARDERGWTHVDRSGTPISGRRFAMVEPFYNGQARVERFDGALEVIAPSGEVLALLREPRVSSLHALSSDLVGYWRTQALAATVRLGVVDALPGTTAEVATRGRLSDDAAERLLRALWEMGIVEPAGAGWTATDKGAGLTRAHSASLADAALEYAGPLGDAWARLADVLRGDVRPAGEVFRDVAADPVRRRAHHRMLAAYADEDYAPWVSQLPLPTGGTVVDAGGGTGALARRIASARPDVSVVLLDLPAVVADVEGPVRPIGVDLFEPWPVEADVVVLARVLHDWDDADARRLLERARFALRAGGRLCILELVMHEDAPGGGLCDLHLLAATGGRERTEGAWRDLLSSAGFSDVAVERGTGVVSLITASRA